MPFVYILKSKNAAKTYVGSTVDLERRLREHNGGNSTFSKKYMPWKLAYSEFFDNLSDARTRKRYLKSAAGRRYIKKNKIIPE